MVRGSRVVGRGPHPPPGLPLDGGGIVLGRGAPLAASAARTKRMKKLPLLQGEGGGEDGVHARGSWFVARVSWVADPIPHRTSPLKGEEYFLGEGGDEDGVHACGSWFAARASWVADPIPHLASP